jgi:hypothetical protein
MKPECKLPCSQEPLDSILSQMNKIHSLKLSFFIIHFNVTFTHKSRFLRGLFPSVFQTKFCMNLSYL